MLTFRPQLRRAARTLSRGGFTLVELLVVIGIIAILAGVALGPITNGIKKAKQSAGVQSAHAIGLAMFSFANDNSQLYPDTNNPTSNPTAANGAGAVAGPLCAGGYVTDPSIFYISGAAETKYGGTTASAAANIAASNVSWDFACSGAGTGISSVNVPYLPIMWSTVAGGTTQPNIAATAGTSITTTPALTNPFQQAGIVVFYASNSSAFLTANASGVCTMVTTSNPGGAPTAATTLLGGG